MGSVAEGGEVKGRGCVAVSEVAIVCEEEHYASNVALPMINS